MTAQYTVFAKYSSQQAFSGWLNNCAHRAGMGLNDLIEHVKDCSPVAWAPEAVDMGNRKAADKAFAESIAAGRVIELVDGRYVARGVEEKKEEPVQSIGALIRAKLAEVAALEAEYDANSAMIARDDTDGARHYARKRAFIRQCHDLAAERAAKQSTAHPALPALQRIASEGDPLHGSAFLKR